MVKFPLYIESSQTESPIKSLSFACLLLLGCVLSTCFIGVVDEFSSDSFNEALLFLHLRTGSLI